jgi:hypothetical protein
MGFGLKRGYGLLDLEWSSDRRGRNDSLGFSFRGMACILRSGAVFRRLKKGNRLGNIVSHSSYCF